MKKLLAGIAALGMISQAAYATQARLVALGLDELDNEGSHYIQDSRNIFLNAANVNNYEDLVILELGLNGQGVSMFNNAWVDQDNNPKAQGGFLKRMGNYVVGAYLGNESNTSAFLRIASASNLAAAAGVGATSTPKMLNTADNQIDLFIGSEAANGLKWGASLVYLANENDNRKEEEKAGSVRLGVIGQKWDAYANVSFMNTAENEVTVDEITNVGPVPTQTFKQEFDGKLGIQVGGGHDLGKGRAYGYFKTFSWDQKDGANYTGLGALNGTSGTSEGSFTSYLLGYGIVESVNTNGNLFIDFHAKKTDVELKMSQKVQIDVLILPLTLGYEHAATSWLTVRGSLVHNVYSAKDNKNFAFANAVARNLISNVYGSEGKGTLQNATRVQTGATLTFGNLNVDGLIGTSTAGNLSTDNFFSRAAITYKF